ncbi:MAG: yefA [Mucilaginibacter sp.]|uniref:GDP-mannose 4,6-dehydratase n=1 Tax=Mucilaginibacter sp. TaxID=1882438 RepID=UPI002619358D|nr:GDP-mannose 4,6-dehydratase [Mucilaginibacter sp.]MDB5002312.1 yefA [Mucilaginibacter sp.]
MIKKALICGVSGQDGAYLSKLLLEKDYQVYGGSRDAQASSFTNLKRLGIRDQIDVVSINIIDFRSTLQTIMKVKPEEIYNLAGQSSVGLSFEQPVETLESISIGTLNLLEAIRFSGQPIKLYNAGSSECFGDTGEHKANEETAFKPRSPYAVAKATAFWEVANYREAYNLFACTGILFNHESPLRPARFVTQKIIGTAVRIYNGSREKLALGNIEIERDWGFAPDYVEAMWLMLQQDIADDFVISTGTTTSLREFIDITFNELGLKASEHIVINKDFMRPTDLKAGHSDPSKAFNKLGWKAKATLNDVIKCMIDSELLLSKTNLNDLEKVGSNSLI